MGDPLSVRLRVSHTTHPELHDALVALTPRQRSERLRVLATIGLMRGATPLPVDDRAPPDAQSDAQEASPDAQPPTKTITSILAFAND